MAKLSSKADQYAGAVIEAIVAMAITEGAPDFNSALAALSYVQGYLLAKLSPEQRAVARAELEAGIDGFVDGFLNPEPVAV
jgi:hypothetical protein